MLNHFYQVIDAVVPAKYLDDKTIYHLQPSGRFVIGGPQVIITHKLLILSPQKTSVTTNFCSSSPLLFLLNRVMLV